MILKFIWKLTWIANTALNVKKMLEIFKTIKLQKSVWYWWKDRPIENIIRIESTNRPTESVSESCSVLSDSLGPYELYSPWNSLGQILEWVAFLLFRGSSQPRDWTQVSCTAGGFFTNRAIRKAPRVWKACEISEYKFWVFLRTIKVDYNNRVLSMELRGLWLMKDGKRKKNPRRWKEIKSSEVW